MSESEEKITRKPYRKLVALDVDGVLNSYVSGWTGAGNMPDPANPGAMQFLRDLILDDRFEVVIVSSRLNEESGERAVRDWLDRELVRGIGFDEACLVNDSIAFSATRPPAFVTIDDRAVSFMGEWPSLDRLAAFQPYYKKPAHLRPNPLTAVAAVDALMMRIGRIAAETGCPDETTPLDWIEERARIGRPDALPDFDDFDARAAKGFDPADTIEIEENDTPVRTVAVIRADLPAQWEETARRITLDGVEHYLVDGVELTGDDEATVDGLALGIGEVPERMARYAAARGMTVDEVLADPAVVKVPEIKGTTIVSDEAGGTASEGGKVDLVRRREAQRIDYLARTAIVHMLSGSDQTVQPERVRATGGHEWRAPYRGGHVWMPDIVFRGCQTDEDARSVVEAFLDAFGHGMSRQVDIDKWSSLPEHLSSETERSGSARQVVDDLPALSPDELPDPAEILADLSFATTSDGRSLIEAEDRVRRQRMLIKAIRNEYPEITDADAVALHRSEVAKWSVDRVLGRVCGFGSVPAKGSTMVVWENGTGAFVFPNAILPPDDPALADRIVGTLYSVWLTGLRTENPKPAPKQAGHEEGDPGLLQQAFFDRLDGDMAEAWLKMDALVEAGCSMSTVPFTRIWKGAGGWRIGAEMLSVVDASELSADGLKARIAGMVRRAQ